MPNILLMIFAVMIGVAALLPAAPGVSAEPSNGQKSDKPAAPGKLLPMKRAGSSNACAAYGPDFVKIDGSETCVKIGGAVSIGVGGSHGSR